MIDDDITPILLSLVQQYGIPTPDLTPRFKSLLRDVLVNHPREMNLLITGLEEGIPAKLNGKKGTVPYEIVSEQMIDQIYTTRCIERKAATWMVRTWAEAIGFPIPAPIISVPLEIQDLHQKTEGCILQQQRPLKVTCLSSLWFLLGFTYIFEVLFSKIGWYLLDNEDPLYENLVALILLIILLIMVPINFFLGIGTLKAYSPVWSLTKIIPCFSILFGSFLLFLGAGGDI